MENRPGSFMFASAPLSERPFRYSLYIYCKRNSILGNVSEEKFKKSPHGCGGTGEWIFTYKNKV